MEPEVRRRKKAKKDNLEEELVKDADVQEENVKPVVSCSLRNEFWLTRIVYLRFLAGIYFVAFLIGYHQNRQLVGDDGLLPAKHYLQTLAGLNMADPWRRFLSAPSLLWLAEPWNQIDPILDGIALVGMLISMIIFLTGAANFLALLGLWMLYHSLVNVGQNWYSFGWESQLLETGFLAMWIVPLWTWSKFPREMPTPLLGIAGHRWLIMRIMIGAGLIKIRGDPCWRDLTCMNYFFETQPNPNPQSWLAHQAPEAWHKFETVGNHVVELMSPWLTIMPFRWAGMTNGFLQVLFQVVLISTGNLSFLNWLTIVPSIWFFDDLTLSALFSKLTLERRQKEVLASEASASSFSYQRLFRKGVNMSVGLMLAYLSIPIVTNLISPNQIMNTSFEPFR